jgi:hypothetical protein
VLPFWLDMERTLEAYRSGDRSMLLWNVLQSHQTTSYNQAVETLQSVLEADPDGRARRFVGFDGSAERFHAPPQTPGTTVTPPVASR